MPVSVREASELRRLVTPAESAQSPRERWFLFRHAFSGKLVDWLLDELGVASETTVLDPFVGSGTTLLRCAARGVRGIGVDRLPLACFVTAAKLLCPSPAAFKGAAKRVRDAFTSAPRRGMAPLRITSWAFRPVVRGTIERLYGSISRRRSPAVRGLLHLALLSVVESTSLARKDGGFLRHTRRRTSPNRLLSHFDAAVTQIHEDLTDETSLRRYPACGVLQGDARALPLQDSSVDAVITSPPYLNRQDYTRVYALELGLGFVRSDRELRQTRRALLRSHVEASGPVADKRLTPAMRRVARIARRVEEAGPSDRRVPPMIEGYFRDLELVLREIRRVVRPGGKVAFVVGNVRFAGVAVPVDEVLAEIGREVGLQPREIIVARWRGNAPQQMARFSREAARESIVIWER